MSMHANGTRTEGGSSTQFCQHTLGGRYCAAIQTLFSKGSKLFDRDPAWPVLHLHLNLYEYEMLIERDLCLRFIAFLNNRQQPDSD